MVDLLSLVPDAARAALTQWLEQRGEPAYRARQVVPLLWERPVGSWDDATELPAALRRALAVALPLRRLAPSAGPASQDSTWKDPWGLGERGAGEGRAGPPGGSRTPPTPSPCRCG